MSLFFAIHPESSPWQGISAIHTLIAQRNVTNGKGDAKFEKLSSYGKKSRKYMLIFTGPEFVREAKSV